jgi:hypothetical protein
MQIANSHKLSGVDFSHQWARTASGRFTGCVKPEGQGEAAEGREAEMTLFIACLLIYHYNLDWYWYAAAAALWLIRTSIYVGLLKRKS